MLALPYDIHATGRRQNKEGNLVVGTIPVPCFRNEVPFFMVMLTKSSKIFLHDG
jgi:hypothetical protein